MHYNTTFSLLYSRIIWQTAAVVVAATTISISGGANSSECYNVA